MAILIYLPSSGDAAVTPATWIFPNQINPLTFAGVLERGATALTTKLEATGTTSPITKAMLRYVIGPLDGQSIAGTVRMVMKALESNAGANANLAMAIKIIKPDGSDRAVLLAVTSSDAASAPYEITTTLATKFVYTSAEVQPLTLTTQSATAGDYLVIEIGFRSATTTTRNISLRYGNAAASDFAYTVDLTTDLNPWVEFSQTITFQTPPVTLVIQDAAHAHTAESPGLAQHNILAVQDAAHAHTADTISLAQHNILAIADAAHGHTAENIVLTYHAPSAQLAIQDAVHSHTADVPALTQHNILAIQDVSHGHTADGLALTQHNILAIADASHGHTAENISLTQHNILTVQDGAHTHQADSPGLAQHNIVSIADASHGHGADNVTLTAHVPGGEVLIIADASHGHTAESPGLTQHNILAIQDASHGHGADNIILSMGMIAGRVVVADTSYMAAAGSDEGYMLAAAMDANWMAAVGGDSNHG